MLEKNLNLNLTELLGHENETHVAKAEKKKSSLFCNQKIIMEAICIL